MTLEKNTYDFVGSLTTLEPLMVSLKGVTTAKQHKMPRNGQDLAYFPASSIRGALRHTAHKLINEIIKKEGDSLDIVQHFMLSQGYFVESKESAVINNMSEATSKPIDANEALREVNPFMSLFGRWGLTGHLGISNALTTSAGDVQQFSQGARGVVFERSPELLDDLSDTDVDRYFSIMSNESLAAKDVAVLKKEQTALKKELKTATDDNKDLIFKKLNDLDQQIKQRKEDKGDATESIRRPLNEIEAIIANAKLTHRMTIRSGTTLELGLFIATLAAFARDPQLGGNAKNNYGKINGHWAVKTWLNDTDFQKTQIGTVTINEDGFELIDDTEDKVLSSAYQEWITAQDLDLKRYM